MGKMVVFMLCCGNLNVTPKDIWLKHWLNILRIISNSLRSDATRHSLIVRMLNSWIELQWDLLNARNLLMFGKRLRLLEHLYTIMYFYYCFYLALWLNFMQIYTL